MTSSSRAFRRSVPPVRRRRPGRILLVVLATVFLVVVVFPWLASFATDWLWFNEIPFESVFVASLGARTLLFAIAGAVAFAFIYANLRSARQGIDLPTLIMDTESTPRLDL